MKTLEEFNKERMLAYEFDLQATHPMKPHRNGIECPHCSDELWDSCPGMTLTSSPPKKNVHCPACGYFGYRLA